MRFTVVTLDHHLSDALTRAGRALAREIPGLELRLHVAAEWMGDEAAAELCRADIADADIVLVTQIFMDEQAQAILPALRARRDACDAMVCVMSCPEVMRLTRMGRFSMGGEGGEPGAWSPAALFRRLRGSGESARGMSGGERQMRQLRRIPKLLRWIPGTAQDVRAYYLVLQYWLAGSEANLAGLVRLLVDRYATARPRRALRVAPPREYPEVGVYHPDLPDGGMAEDAGMLPRAGTRGTVGVLLMRSYLLPGNTAHYDAVIRALEARGLNTVPVFAAGLDARPAVERHFVDRDGRPTIDAMLSLTGFSLVGGPAYNDSEAAQAMLAALDVPCIAAQALEFQSVEQWRDDARGLHPLQATLMVALPELDGATQPLVFGGKAASTDGGSGMQPIADRVERLAGRVASLVALRRSARAERRVGVVLFAFPPNAGNLGTAAFLAVWESLHRVLLRMRDEGYTVEVPDTPDALRERVLGGNAERLGAVANVHARVRVDDHVRGERWLREIEAVWGPAPGKQNSDGASLWILGERFGNVFIGIQPAFGYEGDPMRLLFERGFAPTHSFAAFYRWLREGFGAHALLHFGTHGALEFMPGKQVGLGAGCWPDRLLGDLPNVYLYASNNPSEGALAKRRSAATLVSYLTPPITHAGLYRGLLDLKASVERWGASGNREQGTGNSGDGADSVAMDLIALIQAQAAAVELAEAEPGWTAEQAATRIPRLREQVLELEYSLIPHGLHVVGEPMPAPARVDTLLAIAEAGDPVGGTPPLHAILTSGGADDPAGDGHARARAVVQAMVAGGAEAGAAALRGEGVRDERARAEVERLAAIDRLLAEDHETPAVIRALDGAYIRPAPGGDLLRNPAVLPTGRNLYGFDPFRVPSQFALRDGRKQAERLLERHRAEHGALPETVAMVLWGTDNMKSEGGPLAQALALMGAEARFDGYGRLVGAVLVPLAELGRPRVDVVVTLSGIFRDLLPLQVRLLAEAAWLAASADEAPEQNLLRKHALAYAAEAGCDLETAALRVFSNAEGAYGANVNQLVDNGRWSDEDQLAETWLRRKQFAYGRADGGASASPDLLRSLLAGVDLSYQNLESVEMGVADVDQYVDSLGGMARAAARERGAGAPVYIGDQTRGEGRVRTLTEQMDLEARTRVLNPRWYEAMLGYGYEGVRQIETRVTAALGWSATTDAVSPWIYTRVAETYVLDAEMRERLAKLNPASSARLAGRLLEANQRGYWSPDDDMLDALRDAADELEDRLEGIHPEVAA